MIRKLLLQRVSIGSSFRGNNNTNAVLCSLYTRSRCYFSIKLNDSFPTNNEQEITNKIDTTYNESGYDGLLTLADNTFNEQDFNVTALSYERLLNSDYGKQKEENEIYNLYYKFIATLHLLRDFDSAKHYIEDVIIPRFGENYDGKLYGLYGLILKDGFDDIGSAEECFQKSIELKPGIDNLFSYLNYSSILHNKDDVDWQYLYNFSLDILSFASFDAYIVSQHAITCTALAKYNEAETYLNNALDIYSNADSNQFLSYFPDLSHISLKCVLQIVCQYWFDNKLDDKILSLYNRIENDYNKNVFISKYLLQIISPIMSEMHWIHKQDKKKGVEFIFENKLLLEQEEYFQSLKFIHCFKYWTQLNNLNCIDVMQHADLYPFYFGCCCIVNGLFENNTGQINSCKYAFNAIPKDKVQIIYDEIEKYTDEADKANKETILIFNYIHKLMQQMFVDTLNKIAKISWGNIAIYKFAEATEIAEKILQFDANNVMGYGCLFRICLEQKEYEKAVGIFEEHITEETCKSDDMLYYNLMPYYGVSLCFVENETKKEKGNKIMLDLMQRLNNDKSDEIHVIHKEQIYRWYAYKLQYVDKEYKNAIEFYEKSFVQNELIKYPPVQLEIAKCCLQINDMEKAKENINEAITNGKEVFGDFVEDECKAILNQIV